METLLNAGVSIQKTAEEFLDLQKLKETQNANSISAHKNKTKPRGFSHQIFCVAYYSQEPFQSGAMSLR